MNESDPCSNVHYLSSSENKAWKNSGLYGIWTQNIWKSYIWTAGKDMNESDPQGNVHYLNSSENEAWKKFRPVQDLNSWPLRYWCNTLPTELTNIYS